MAEPVIREIGSYQDARRRTLLDRLGASVTGVPARERGLPLAGRQALLLPVLDRIATYDGMLAEMQAAEAEGRIDLAKARMAAGEAGTEAALKIILAEMESRKATGVAKVGAEGETLLALMKDAREMGPSASIIDPKSREAFAELKQAVADDLAAVASGNPGGRVHTGASLWEAIAEGLGKIEERDRVAALRQLATGAGFQDPDRLLAALGSAEPSAAAFDLTTGGRAALSGGGAFTAWSRARSLLSDGIEANGRGSKAESQIADQAERLRRTGGAVGDKKMFEYIDFLSKLSTGQAGLDDPRTKTVLDELGVDLPEVAEAAGGSVTLPPEVAESRARLVRMADEIDAQASEPDLYERRQRILGSTGFAEFMRDNGISDPREGWRSLNAEVRRRRKAGGLLAEIPDAAPAVAPPGAATAPAVSAAAPAPARSAEPAPGSHMAPADDPTAPPTVGPYLGPGKGFGAPSKPAQAVEGAESPAAALTDLAGKTRAMRTAHLRSRLG